MRARLTRSEQAFQREVRAFVARHWPAPGGVPRNFPHGGQHAARVRWFAALVARGWSVPAWPVAHGGTGWSSNELIMWLEETARAGAPLPDPAATQVAGPLLCAYGTADQQAAHLPAIRGARGRWCVALEPDRPIVLAPDGGSGWRLNGSLPALPGAAHGEWLLCHATAPAGVAQGTLVLVDLSAAGVQRQTLSALDGTADLAAVQFDQVALTSEAVLDSPGAAARLLDELPLLPGAFVPRSPGLRAHAGQIRALAEDLGGDDGWQAQHSALEISLSALDGLERRSMAATGPVAARLRQAALLRSRELARDMAELAASLLGYYALPFPEARLIDNEGPIGHDYALTAVTGRLRAAAGHGDSDKNRLARWLSGP